jgi:glycosyltransferase involved in cell wall biosynthesis
MEKTIVCVLGMHRSGSSYVAGRIRGLGIDFGDDEELIAGDIYNERGYHENKDLSYLGEEILVAFGGDHIHPPFLESGWEKSLALEPLRAKAKYLIDKKFEDSEAWGWKDPRNSLLLPFWKQIVLPTHYIITIRNPLEVAESLLRRNGIAIRHGSELWFLHVASAIFHTRGFRRKFIFFDNARYSPLEVDEELRKFLFPNCDSAASDPTPGPEFSDSLVHHRETDEQAYANTDIHPLAKALYHALCQLHKAKDRSDFDFAHIPNEGQKYESWSILHLIETEPSLLINPHVLSNCLLSKRTINQSPISKCGEQTTRLNQTISGRDEEIARLNQTVSECNEQIAVLNQTASERNEQIVALTQTLTKQVNAIYELRSDNEQLRQEADSLFATLEKVLQSKSWKLTRPLRGLLRFARGEMPTNSSRQLIYQIGRVIGRKFPVSFKVKAKCRTALLKFVYRDQKEKDSILSTPQHAATDQLSLEMRPRCCGLEAGLVSVVLPVFNQADLLAASIESVLAQTYTNFELIVINDGSTDDVESVLENYVDNPKVRVYNQPNQKLPKALTNGFTYARGEYWTWTSADNVMEPTMLEVLVQKLELEPMVGMVYADYLAIDDRGEVLKNPNWRHHNRPCPDTGEIRLPRSVTTLNTVQDNFIGPCFVYRGWIGRCLGEYDSQLGVEDYDYWMRINAFFTISHVDKRACLYRYRVHDNTLSANAKEHGILEKARRLMAYEKKRAAFYKESLTYIADTIGFDWLVLQGVNKRNISNIEDRGSLIDQGAANLIIVGVKSLEVHLEQLRYVENSLIVIFDDGAADYVKLKRLRPGSSLVLVYDESAASRVRLVSDFPVLDAASAQAHRAVIAFHKNKSFILSTRKKEDRYTLLPEKLTSRKKISRVLLQVDSFTQGGMENVVIDLAISLEKLGFEVSLAILGKEGVAAAKARDQGLKVTSFGSPPTKADYEDYLRRNKVEIVNAHFSIYGAEICAALDIPFLQTIHNAYVWFEPQTTANYQLADQYTSRYICVSATAARYADVALGLDVRKMAIIPNGIDPNAIDHTRFNDNRMNLRNLWGVGSECPVFLNVASVMAPKAQLPLVNAFSHVLETIPAAYLVLVGSVMEPTYQQEIEKQIDTLDIQNKVVLVGYDEYVAKYYHAADVFVLPSYWEGWSLSLGEAMANGLPSVMTDVGSAYEFYGNERTEIIQAPFGDITQLNYLNLGQYIYGGDPEFEKRIVIAMIKASGKPRLGIDEYLRKKLDREVAYKKYATYFSELEH